MRKYLAFTLSLAWIGAHYQAAQKSYTDFETLAKKILLVCV